MSKMLRRMLPAWLAVAMMLSASFAAPARAAANDDKRDKCEKAERERQLKEIDHATGKASEKELKDAKEKADKDCN